MNMHLETYCPHECKMVFGNTKEKAFNHLYGEYMEMVKKISAHYLQYDMAEDAAQEVFFKIWKYWHRLEEAKDKKAYVAVLTKNACYTILQKRIQEMHDREEYSNITDGAIREVEEMLIAKQYTWICNKAVDQLSPRQKLVYKMTETGWKSREIAKVLNTAAATVKNQKVKVYNTVRSIMKQVA